MEILPFPHITLMINKTKNISVNERCSDEGCQKLPSAVILAFFTGTSTNISTIELIQYNDASKIVF